MATKKFCDRCDKDITNSNETGTINRTAAVTDVKVKYDLCADCDIQFARDFMNPPKETKNA